MTFFKDYTLSWWQFGLLKLALIACGILIGSQWSPVFRSAPITVTLLALFVLPSLYLVIIFLKQTAGK